jgi:methylenetetrahydrofolate dehydrogenase (NADP+)/methenyltetrahydrofolate cyclohydrolase
MREVLREMPAKVLDGRKMSSDIREELKQRVQQLKERGVTPGIAGVLVGEDPGSVTYMNLKEKASSQVGVGSRMLHLAEGISEDDLITEIERLNGDPGIHGIFVQLPLPSAIDENSILQAVAPQKDVDGFHPISVGKAWLGQQSFLPATPVGIYEMLVRGGYTNLRYKHVVIVNVDNLVGRPLASILAQENIGADVTLCRPDTPALADHTRSADILVVAVNKPRFITADMVKPGVIGIDFGSTYVQDPSTKSGQRVVGDLDFEGLLDKAEALTPVPGGVGPMTVTMLLANTVAAAERQSGAL